jgi:rhomboid family GlyGly-CTERM serine protease
MTSGRGDEAKGLAIPLIVAAACLLVLALPDEGRGLLGYDRAAVAAGEWWRLVTAHLAHLSVRHGLMNVAALAMIAWLFRSDFGPAAWSGGFAVPALVIGVGLYAGWPGVGWYVGLSGVLHGLVAGGGLLWFVRGERLAGGALLAALAAKLAWEAVFGPVPGSEAAAGGSVLVESHLLGAVGGILWATLVAAGERQRRSGRRL